MLKWEDTDNKQQSKIFNKLDDKYYKNKAGKMDKGPCG